MTEDTKEITHRLEIKLSELKAELNEKSIVLKHDFLSIEKKLSKITDQLEEDNKARELAREGWNKLIQKILMVVAASALGILFKGDKGLLDLILFVKELI